MNKIIQDQLTQVSKADLSNYDKAKNEYMIPKRQDIKIAAGDCYLIKIKDLTNLNKAVTINWNAGNKPSYTYYKVEIDKMMGKMIKVNGIAFDNVNKQDLHEIWSGWLTLEDVEVISKL